MNFMALLCSVVLIASLIFYIIAFRNITDKQVHSRKFAVYYDQQEDQKYKEYEKIINKTSLPFNTALLLILAGGLTIGIITYIVVGIWWIALLSFLGGFLVPKWYYQWHENTKKEAMLKQMEQASEIISSVIKSGGGIAEALERASIDVKEPLKSELVRTATQITIGVSVSNAFLELTTRVGIPEMSVVSMAVELQETGMTINLPKLFSKLQKDIRERKRFQKEVKAKTTEIKTSGFIVAAVPFFTITIMRLFAPEFVSPLFNNSVGIAVFLISCSIIIGGVRWMLNLANLEKE